MILNCLPHWPPAELRPLGLRTRKPGSDPLSDNLPLKFGKHAHHLEQRFTGGRRGIDRLVMQIEIDPYGMKFAEGGNKVL